jgi:hypothetical protein
MKKSLIQLIDETHLDFITEAPEDFTLIDINTTNIIQDRRWTVEVVFEVDNEECSEVVVSTNTELILAYQSQEGFEDGDFGFSCWDEVIETLFKEIDIDAVLRNIDHSTQLEYIDCNEKHLGMI